jgi:hypothetical protein
MRRTGNDSAFDRGGGPAGWIFFAVLVLVAFAACDTRPDALSAGNIATAAPIEAAAGPLRKSACNPRYFEDGHGDVVYLTGSHTWNSRQDLGKTDPPRAFDFSRCLDWLERQHHNFFRLWGDSFRCSGHPRVGAST